MKFEIFDPNVPLSMNILLVIANVLNLIYNIPQMVHTYRRKSTRDLSTWFLFLRILGNLIWVVYSVYIANLLMLINNVVTVAASVFVGYYKVREIIKDRNGRYINITIEPLEPVFSTDGGGDEDKWF